MMTDDPAHVTYPAKQPEADGQGGRLHFCSFNCGQNVAVVVIVF